MGALYTHTQAEAPRIQKARRARYDFKDSSARKWASSEVAQSLLGPATFLTPVPDSVPARHRQPGPAVWGRIVHAQSQALKWDSEPQLHAIMQAPGTAA